MWALSASFGPHTPEQWLELCRHMVKPHPGGGVVLHYDPSIAVAFAAMTEASVTQGEALIWQMYDNIPSQTLLLRGAVSDLLSLQTAREMAHRGPNARLVEFPGIGHAPTLIADDQVQCVADFLLQ
jgi:pimeloyl-ACP methyl ester carboxylesterase